MITGRKESGYFVTSDKEGRKIEGETRQCVHCQYIWERKFNKSNEGNDQYDSEVIEGKKVTRGYCLKCKGFICCRTECINKYGFAPNCTTFEEEEQKLIDKLQKHMDVPELNLKQKDYEVLDSGLIVTR